MSRLNKLAINNEGFLFDPSSGESFTVNASGLSILNALKENQSAERIAKEICDSFDMVPADVERDVMDFISQLRTFHLL